MSRIGVRGDRGSILPLLVGLFLVATLAVAGAVAAGDAFVQQLGVQEVCDGAAVAAAADSAQVGRGEPPSGSLRFSSVDEAISAYLARDHDRRGVRIQVSLSDAARTLSLSCEQVEHVTFGGLFGVAGGVRHVAHAAARVFVRAGTETDR